MFGGGGRRRHWPSRKPLPNENGWCHRAETLWAWRGRLWEEVFQVWQRLESAFILNWLWYWMFGGGGRRRHWPSRKPLPNETGWCHRAETCKKASDKRVRKNKRASARGREGIILHESQNCTTGITEPLIHFLHKNHNFWVRLISS